MKYSELLAVVIVANQIGTTEAKAQARAQIYASELVGDISREKELSW